MAGDRAAGACRVAAFVVSKNLNRRHLSDTQRAMLAAELANSSHGGDRRSDQPARLQVETAPVTQQEAAELMDVGIRVVQQAKQVGTGPHLNPASSRRR